MCVGWWESVWQAVCVHCAWLIRTGMGSLSCVYTRMSLPGLQWHLISEWMEVQCCVWGGWRGKSGCQQALRLCWGSAAPWKYLLYQRKLSKYIFCLLLKQGWFCPTQIHHLWFFTMTCHGLSCDMHSEVTREVYTEKYREEIFVLGIAVDS